MGGGRSLGKRSSTWLSFLRNHLQVSWAIDFFAVTTVGFGRLYVFVVLEHGRRRVVHWAITAVPTMAWVIQQLREATPFEHQPRYLFEMFSATLPDDKFPKGSNWLMLGPSGPRRLRLAVEHLAQF